MLTDCMYAITSEAVTLFKVEDVPLDFEVNFSSSRHERMISLQTNRVLQYSKRVNHLSGWVDGQP